MFHKRAFTLAEVLITLGIIGVVASMTLPALINNYPKKVTAVKVKKFYTNFSQAIKLSEVANGDFKYWEPETAEELYEKFLAPYLKVVNVQKNIHMYGNFTGGIKFIFADGSQAICSRMANMTGYGNGANIFPCVFFTYGTGKWVTNVTNSGYKNPTREVFWFLINDKGQLEPPHMEQNREYNIDSCKKKDVTGNGFTDCGTLLYKDNWEIKDDYPW